MCMSADAQEKDIISLMTVLTLTVRCVIRMLNLFEYVYEIIQKDHDTITVIHFIKCS